MTVKQTIGIILFKSKLSLERQNYYFTFLYLLSLLDLSKTAKSKQLTTSKMAILVEGDHVVRAPASVSVLIQRLTLGK